ncbi:peptidyl-prolyl cis-trans isomerase C [Malonomonas rubra DSM 5091]|uniref:peptidylprolyl isomerase n=1 Tax=Malonomonas rubra DSM 5091 TaxID=1122189 RepID=A0A1M6IJ49_MALRU|nr:peptidyl-prolyl cis-trans isomerase [Malonomonas rubra]SHJ34491.1 peptidyl-prolyl cis-trans isomerase C [Malonomonas rubra DSM 5091]
MPSLLLKSVLSILFLLILTACDQQQPEPQKEAPLLQVGSRSLSLSQFERRLQQVYPKLGEFPYPEQVQLKLELVNRLVEQEMIFAEAERLDIRVSPDELDTAMAELRGTYSAEEYRQILREAGQDEQSWKSGLKLRLITQKLSDILFTKAAQVSEQEAEQYYLANKEEFRRPEELRARQMLFANREDAEEVLKLLKRGGDFAELAKEYSLSPDRENGGNLGYFSKGELPPEFDRALFRLGAGQLSDPVESPYGIHLFLVERRRPAGVRPYAAIKHEIMANLSQQREELAFHQWLEELREKTQISVDWELLKEPDKQDQ